MSDASSVRSGVESGTKKQVVAFSSGSSEPASFLSEEQFRKMLSRERKRSERSRKHLVLMLIDGKGSRTKRPTR